MPRNVDFVQIEAGEDAASVRDRLSFLRGKSVLLIWPEDGTALTRKLDLVLVQREAMRRAIRLALVTHDAQVIRNANELNISTFETIGASQRGRWKRGRTKVFANRWQKPEGERDPGDLMEVASRVRAPVKLPVPSLLRVILLFAVLGALAAVGYFLLPSATVVIRVERIVVASDSVISASPDAQSVDVENGVIPARLQPVEIQETGTRETSGTQDLADTFATGTVTFINRSNNTIQIPAGTVVQTTTGVPVRFLTTSPASLGAGADQRAEVTIEAAADSSGAAGNVDSGLINAVIAEWAADVTVTNLIPTTGGEDRMLPVVTDVDVERLRGAVRQQLFARALSELQRVVTQPEFVIEETLRIREERADWTQFSANVGEFAESLTLNMRAVVDAVVVNIRFGERVAFANLSRALQGRAIDPATIEYQRTGVTDIAEDGSVMFGMTATATVAPQIDTSALAQRIAGLSVTEARAVIASMASLASPAEITVESPWDSSRLPPLPLRITVRVEVQ
jgi:hypothetical protein